MQTHYWVLPRRGNQSFIVLYSFVGIFLYVTNDPAGVNGVKMSKLARNYYVIGFAVYDEYSIETLSFVT